VIAASLFAILGSIVFVCSIVVDQKVHIALIDSLPPQFQDPLNSRYAFQVYVLSSSMPLVLQAEHMKSQVGFWFSLLCFALFSILFFEQTWIRLLPSVLLLAMTVSIIKSWKTYKANCNRLTVADDRDEL
jgi:hypothetical protein